MKLTTTTNVSVDGVMQGLGGPDEDRRGGFERGGWALPLFDNQAEKFLAEVFQRADAFLFGRRTYEIFAGSWGTGSWGADQGDNAISMALNTRPKYLASTTLTDPRWAPTPGRTQRWKWSTRGPRRVGCRSRSTGPPAPRSTRPEARETGGQRLTSDKAV